MITLQELEFHRVEVHKTCAPGALDFRASEFQQLGPLKVDAIAELLGSEVRIRGHLATRLKAGCDRCLATIEFPLDHDFDLFYRPIETIAREEEIEIPDEESEVGFYSGEGIDLTDVVTEQVILSVPMKIICRPDCLGLCPVCGTDRNLEKCQCTSQQAKSPFASLKGEIEGTRE
jgi:uncharacterized protein